MNKHNIKKDDMVMCYKSLSRHGIEYVKSKSYTVTAVLNEDYVIEYYMFSIDTKNRHYNFDDYFITQKEIRKQKLNKINNYAK